jgi:hypothetical protein
MKISRNWAPWRDQNLWNFVSIEYGAFRPVEIALALMLGRLGRGIWTFRGRSRWLYFLSNTFSIENIPSARLTSRRMTKLTIDQMYPFQYVISLIVHRPVLFFERCPQEEFRVYSPLDEKAPHLSLRVTHVFLFLLMSSSETCADKYILCSISPLIGNSDRVGIIG